MSRMKKGTQTIESHSSYLNNKRITVLLFGIDQLALQASSSMHIKSIQAYYNAVEQLYLNVASILSDVEDIEDTRNKYRLLLQAVESDERFRTAKVLRLMLQLTRQFNFKMTTGLQDREFFFRMGSRQAKGLKNIKFFDQSIFGSRGKKDEEEKESTNEGETEAAA